MGNIRLISHRPYVVRSAGPSNFVMDVPKLWLMRVGLLKKGKLVKHAKVYRHTDDDGNLVISTRNLEE